MKIVHLFDKRMPSEHYCGAKEYNNKCCMGEHFDDNVDNVNCEICRLEVERINPKLKKPKPKKRKVSRSKATVSKIKELIVKEAKKYKRRDTFFGAKEIIELLERHFK